MGTVTKARLIKTRTELSLKRAMAITTSGHHISSSAEGFVAPKRLAERGGRSTPRLSSQAASIAPTSAAVSVPSSGDSAAACAPRRQLLRENALQQRPFRKSCLAKQSHGTVKTNVLTTKSMM